MNELDRSLRRILAHAYHILVSATPSGCWT